MGRNDRSREDSMGQWPAARPAWVESNDSALLFAIFEYTVIEGQVKKWSARETDLRIHHSEIKFSNETIRAKCKNSKKKV